MIQLASEVHFILLSYFLRAERAAASSLADTGGLLTVEGVEGVEEAAAAAAAVAASS